MTGRKFVPKSRGSVVTIWSRRDGVHGQSQLQEVEAEGSFEARSWGQPSFRSDFVCARDGVNWNHRQTLPFRNEIGPVFLYGGYWSIPLAGTWLWIESLPTSAPPGSRHLQTLGVEAIQMNDCILSHLDLRQKHTLNHNPQIFQLWKVNSFGSTYQQ